MKAGFHCMPEACLETSASVQTVQGELAPPSPAGVKAGTTLGGAHRGDDATLAPARQKHRGRSGLAWDVAL